MAAGFAVALLSWAVALVLTVGFLIIYVPVIASEERFLRGTLLQMPSVQEVHSHIALSQVKQTTALPLAAVR